nr:farnesyl diphosphate synthase [uncultured Dysosmobacter sp.]
MEQFAQQMETARRMVEARLARFFPGDGLAEAMRYSLMAGGKRIRPILAMKFCEAAGGTPEEALDFGCGVEMLHTYSLIHDDLPCMDDDDLRRGRPTNHKVYGECVATLAGDALQAAAFETVLSAGGEWRHGGGAAKAMAARILAEAAGERGMCGGQYWDTLGDGQPHTETELTEINDKKTGALLRAACMMGVAASLGRRFVDDSCMEAAREYATNLGLAFQIRDDMLDVIGDAGAFGKPIGSDASNGKTTYVTLLGLEECKRRVLDYTAGAKAALEKGKWPGGTEFLAALADSLANREK